MHRRHFIAGAGAAAAAAAAADITTKPVEQVRVGFIGLGERGSHIYQQMLRLKGCRMVAVCDLKPDRVARMQRAAEKAGQPTPAAYGKDEKDYLRMCGRDDIDLVAVVTPWKLHARMCIDAMKAGKHACTETPAALRLEDCWEMVETSEKMQRHCILMENYCYFREVMCILNLLRQGVLGEPMHVHAGYQKEALYYSVSSDGTLTFAGEGALGTWGNYYPTHFAGPSSQWLGINRGDSYDYIVSLANVARSFNNYGRDVFGPTHPLATTKFDMTDINNSLIRTKNGHSLHLFLDTRSPRPYRHVYTLTTSMGIYEHTEKRIHIHGRSPGEWTRQGKRTAAREWEPLSKYYAEYDHPLWRELGETATGSGHGGGDYMCFYRLIEALRRGVYPDIDVYDTVTWSVITDLSNQSARNRSKAIDFPDFTRGRWKERKPIPINGADLGVS